MLAQQRGGGHRHVAVRQLGRPGRHLEVALLRMLDGAEDAAGLHVGVGMELPGIEHRAGGHAGLPQCLPGLALAPRHRPFGQDLVQRRLVLDPLDGRVEALVVLQLRAAQHVADAVPVLLVGAAGEDVDVIVRPAALAGEDARRRGDAGDGLVAGARARLAGVRHGRVGNA